MAKTPPKSGQRWSSAEVKQLRTEAKGNTPTPLIAHHLGRSEAAVRAKAAEKKVSLKPTNKPPYGTAGKRRGK
jgi:hypothetical protein